MSNPERLKHALGDGNNDTSPPAKRIKRNDGAYSYSTSSSSASSRAQLVPADNKNRRSKKKPKNILAHLLDDEIADKDTIAFLMGETPYNHRLLIEDDAAGQQQVEPDDAPAIYTPEDNNLLLDKQLMESDLEGFRSRFTQLQTRLRQMPSPQPQQSPTFASQNHLRQRLLDERTMLLAMIESSEDWLQYIEHGDPLDGAA
ncbi:hypothetical protein PG985_008247 [Apiospora marii]|uniref:Uncharacterized protein n=1 Tax=Apiospora marii TaxID=335849 RepID=A0ABR1RGB3_9PEZI